jgi:chromosome partitioning protein
MLGVIEPPAERSSHVIFDEDAEFSPGSVRSLGAFDLLPASSRLTAGIRRLNRPIDVFWAKEFGERHLEEYDIVLYDTAAALTVYSLNALVASQFVIIPVAPEYQPIVGAEQTYQTCLTVRRKLNPALRDAVYLLTMVDGRKKTHHTYRRYLRDRYEEAVLEQVVRTSASLAVATNDGKTAFDFDPRGRGSVDYANVADEVVRRLLVGAADEPASAL